MIPLATKYHQDTQGCTRVPRTFREMGAARGGMDFSEEWVGRTGQGLWEEDGVSEVHGVSEKQAGSQCGVKWLP